VAVDGRMDAGEGHARRGRSARSALATRSHAPDRVRPLQLALCDGAACRLAVHHARENDARNSTAVDGASAAVARAAEGLRLKRVALERNTTAIASLAAQARSVTWRGVVGTSGWSEWLGLVVGRWVVVGGGRVGGWRGGARVSLCLPWLPAGWAVSGFRGVREPCWLPA
jgi:hypothetical protein